MDYNPLTPAESTSFPRYEYSKQIEIISKWEPKKNQLKQIQWNHHCLSETNVRGIRG